MRARPPRSVTVLERGGVRSYVVMPSDGDRFSWTLPDNARGAFELAPGVIVPTTCRVRVVRGSRKRRRRQTAHDSASHHASTAATYSQNTTAMQPHADSDRPGVTRCPPG